MQIFAVWDKGRENAPDLVRRCFDRWEALNPGHELVVFDREGMLAAMPPLGTDPRTLAIQAATDILRIHLLATRGGIWTDATVLPIRPLDDFIEDYLSGSGFFFYASPGRGRRIANWFIAARPKNPILAKFDTEIRQFWDRPRDRERRILNRYRLGFELRRLPRTFVWKARGLLDPHYPVRPAGRKKPFYPYFWFHAMVGYMESVDPEMAAALAAMPYRPASVPLSLQKTYRKQPDVFASTLPNLLAASPLHKLDWRQPLPDAVFDAVEATWPAGTS